MSAKICVTGCCGRMGRMLVASVYENGEVVLGGAVEITGNEFIGKDIGEVCSLGRLGVIITDSVKMSVQGCDVLIDFTNPAHTLENLQILSDMGIGMVIGTTGFSQEENKKISDASRKIPIVMAPNMSVGVNLLFKLTEQVARLLGEEYDIEIIESHHNKKKDAPSGTALGLAKSVASGRRIKLEDVACYGRKGMIGERRKGEIGIHAIRGGDIIGEHSVLFCTEGERVELVHKASSRMTFAKGAIRAALFLSGKKSGLFDMTQVISL